VSNIPAEFWESAAGRELAATLHESYWDALECLTAIEKALRSAGIKAGSETVTELEQSAQMVKTAHDQVATLNDRLCPDKIF
jgi:hypothetical protein